MTDQPEALRLAKFCDGNVLYHPAAIAKAEGEKT